MGVVASTHVVQAPQRRPVAAISPGPRTIGTDHLIAEMLTHREQRLAKATILDQLTIAIAEDRPAVALLASSADPRRSAEFCEILARKFVALKANTQFSDLFSDFLGFCGDPTNHVAPAIKSALDERKAGLAKRRYLHRQVVKRLMLAPRTDEEKITFLESITKEILVTPLPEPYPPYKHWVYESKAIERRWRKHIEEGPQPDKRLPRLPMHREQPKCLERVIGENESVLIRDANTREIIAVVLRDFCSDGEILEWINGVVEDVIGLKKSVRKEDSGKLVSVGYTAGARSKPQFDWARNLLSQKHSPEFLRSKDFQSSSVFAVFWNMLHGRMPDELLSDFDAYLAENNMCRMDTNAKSESTTGKYMLQRGEDLIEFDNEELAPPAGVFGCNYARAIHKENQPHRFAFSWTTGRKRGRKAGGHFYLARYGIKVISTANTVIAWRPEEEHGTSLQDRDPGDDYEPPFLQSGMCKVTSTRLASIWQRYRDEELSAAAAAQEYADDLEEDVASD